MWVNILRKSIVNSFYKNRVENILILSISVIMLYSSLSKLFGIFVFIESLNYYDYIPDKLTVPIGMTIPILEFIIALLIWVPSYRYTIIYIYQLLIGFFILLLLLNYGKIMPFGCGCFGPSESERITWIVILRDLLFMIPAWGAIICGKWNKLKVTVRGGVK